MGGDVNKVLFTVDGLITWTDDFKALKSRLSNHPKQPLANVVEQIVMVITITM